MTHRARRGFSLGVSRASASSGRYRGNLDENGGDWVRDHRAIVRHYLRGAFCTDLLSTFPFDAVADAIVADSGGGAADDASSGEGRGLYFLVRSARMLRLLKVCGGARARAGAGAGERAASERRNGGGGGGRRREIQTDPTSDTQPASARPPLGAYVRRRKRV